MNTIYTGYWAVKKKLQSEIDSISLWDNWNNTKNEKKIKLTSKDIANQNHNENLAYEFCSIDEENDQYPFCYVTVVPKNKHIGVNFIDDSGRKYLTYLFHEQKEDRTLFLREVWYYHFTTESSDSEEYRIHFVFDEEGNINYRKYDEKNQKIEDYESNRKFEMSGLYEPYPVFGEYDSLIRLERNLPLDIFPGKGNQDPDQPDGSWFPPAWRKS